MIEFQIEQWTGCLGYNRTQLVSAGKKKCGNACSLAFHMLHCGLEL